MNFSNGQGHALRVFRVFKESTIHVHSKIKLMSDRGYEGIKNLHSNRELPKKRGKGKLLTKAEQRKNRTISSGRAGNENVIGMLKSYKIIADRYCNRRKSFGLSFNLIAGICNWELSN